MNKYKECIKCQYKHIEDNKCIYQDSRLCKIYIAREQLYEAEKELKEVLKEEFEKLLLPIVKFINKILGGKNE